MIFLISNIFELAFFWGERYLFCAFLWFLFVFPLQFVFLPILYEFINKKSQIFLFLNKQKNLIFCLKSLFLALVADVFFLIPLFISLEVTFEYFLFLLSFCFCFGTIFAGYFGLAIWLRLRKCILFRLRKIIKSIGKWLSKRKFATLKNIIITMHLIFAGEIVAICFSPNTDSYLFLLFSEIMPLLLVEIISILSFVKKQKVKPFQKGVIFIVALLIFIHTQLATILQFLTILRWDSHFDPNNISHLNNVIVNFLINIMGLQEF